MEQNVIVAFVSSINAFHFQLPLYLFCIHFGFWFITFIFIEFPIQSIAIVHRITCVSTLIETFNYHAVLESHQ